jgi:hypothetical protein
VRAVLRDPEARGLLTGDPAFRELVAAEVRAERERQELAERERQAAEARERAAAFAPRQVSQAADPWAGDFEHSAEFMARVQSGESAERARASHDERAGREAAEREQRQAVLYEAPVFCGKPIGGGLACRPATRCPDCQGKRRAVINADSDLARYTRQSGPSVATKGLAQPERTGW